MLLAACNNGTKALRSGTPMKILQTIEAELTQPTSELCLISIIDVADWVASDETIPELSHLPRPDQLTTWARQRGWSVTTTIDGATILVTRYLYLEKKTPGFMWRVPRKLPRPRRK